jgi:hypothetical protein
MGDIDPRVVPVFQVANSSYVWLPLVPREDGLGYTLLELEEWRPRDYIGQVADKSCPVMLCSRTCISLPGPEEPTPRLQRAAERYKQSAESRV